MFVMAGIVSGQQQRLKMPRPDAYPQLARSGGIGAFRASSASAPRLPDTGRRPQRAPTVRLEISRFPNKKRAHMPGSATAPGRTGACDDALERVASRSYDSVGTQDYPSIAAQWLAYAYPCQRFTSGFAASRA